MIDQILQSLVDRVIQLQKYREENVRRLFDTFIEPIYRDAEAVSIDYMEVLAALVVKLDSEDEDIPEILRWLELRRSNLVGVRTRLRALLFEGGVEMSLFPATLVKKFTNPLVMNFIEGITGVLTGCLSLTESGHIRIGAYPFEKFDIYGDTGHTLIDIFESFSARDKPKPFKRLLAHNARRQQTAVAKSWAQVVQARNEIKLIAHQ